MTENRNKYDPAALFQDEIAKMKRVTNQMVVNEIIRRSSGDPGFINRITGRDIESAYMYVRERNGNPVKPPTKKDPYVEVLTNERIREIEELLSNAVY